jgi:hypothetical protein
MSEYLSWSETAWATQEERLAVETKGAKLVIGVPKEHDMDEHRILLNPADGRRSGAERAQYSR